MRIRNEIIKSWKLRRKTIYKSFKREISNRKKRKEIDVDHILLMRDYHKRTRGASSTRLSMGCNATVCIADGVSTRVRERRTYIGTLAVAQAVGSLPLWKILLTHPPFLETTTLLRKHKIGKILKNEKSKKYRWKMIIS